jgi:hypothetical protein
MSESEPLIETRVCIDVPAKVNFINFHRTTMGLVVLGMDGSVLFGRVPKMATTMSAS